MRHLGFSTGALAKSDFRKGIRLQKGRVDAIELSALRESELEELIKALPDLDLETFHYVSFHAPSQRKKYSEEELVDQLREVVGHVNSVIVHPDVIEHPRKWLAIEEFLVIENMDQRKPIGRTAREMQEYFDLLPKARFCFDIGHARQVDPTLSVAVEMLHSFLDRLSEVHISEVDAASKHVSISSAAMKSYARIASLIPQNIPVIIESVICPDAINAEVRMARSALGDEVQWTQEIEHMRS